MMESPPSVEETVACIATLYHNPNPDEKSQANQWLQKVVMIHIGVLRAQQNAPKRAGLRWTKKRVREEQREREGDEKKRE